MCDFFTRWFAVFTHSQPAMTTDPSIREQTYQYFLQEAPELLQTLEQGLLSLKQGCSINQVNNLMRVTHTLKGAATSVELTTIATVAHSLEDIFRSLCQPDGLIDSETEALLFEGFECLRLPLTAELTGRTIDHTEALNRAAAVFAQLQTKLGNCFDQTAPLPTSTELGFDITQSIFETGVEQRLNQMAAALPSAAPDEIAPMLRSQAEVFLGLGESLNLPGFGAIAQAAIAALDNHPDQTIAIAQAVLSDFQKGQADVLAGDRTQGGQPSELLQQLAGLTGAPEFTTASIQTSVNKLQNETASNPLLETIWGGQEIPTDPTENPLLTSPVTAIETTSVFQENPNWSNQQPAFEQTVTASTFPFQKESISPPPHVRITIKHLDELNHSVGELLTNQNRQFLQIEQLQTTVQTLRTRLKQHQQLLTQLRQTQVQSAPELRQTRKRKSKKQTPLRNDSALVQSLLDNLVQLTEATETIELFTRQSNQILEQQRQLLANNRDALIEARMLPLAEVFGRFPQVLRQLENLHNKQVALELRGTEVLVHKVVAEKLYDPLLHLIRNAFDHGIEPVDVRRQRGKQEKGQIEICAHNQGRCLVIEVRDDGKGIDFEQIRQRAIEKQWVSAEDASHYNQAQLINLLFKPGFSTATQVSDLSGRGIGLDVVQNQLEALRGSVTVHSIPGQGTTFTLQIPLSLSIAQLLVCQAGTRTYTFFDDTIEQILIPQSSQIQERNHCKVLQWGKKNDQRLVPIHSLAQILNYDSPVFHSSTLSPQSPFAARETMNPVILIRYQDDLVGFEVDQLIGEQELVIRPFGSMIGSPSYIHGASVLADGQLALVIDGTVLIRRVFDQQGDRLSSKNWVTPVPQMLPPSPEQYLAHIPGSAPPLLTPEAKSNARILVIEDSITTRQALVLALQKAGYQVFQAKDGQEGIEQLQHQHGIQLVICDIEMPRLNGLEFLRHCQQIPGSADIPVITLTSRNDEQYRVMASQLGAAAYMTKPYMEHKLLMMVKNLLERTMMIAMQEVR
jgi:chemotaxis protein histidine kinase CheA/ActR/RegA family two-component response regulator